MDWGPLILTFQLAIVTTILLFIVSVPLAYWLAFTNQRFKPIIEAIISMPLVLPPTVIGFYLLIALGPQSGIGTWLQNVFDFTLVFSFQGLIIGSMVYSIPFMVHPIQSGFSNLPNNLSEASLLLGKSRWITLIKVLLPNIKNSIITGLILTFAHTIGEFGVVLMIGGNIPDKTRVASIAIYDEVESLNYAAANKYSLILFVISFLVLLAAFSMNRQGLKKLLR